MNLTEIMMRITDLYTAAGVRQDIEADDLVVEINFIYRTEQDEPVELRIVEKEMNVDDRFSGETVEEALASALEYAQTLE